MKVKHVARVRVRGREASAEVDREFHCQAVCLVILKI